MISCTYTATSVGSGGNTTSFQITVKAGTSCSYQLTATVTATQPDPDHFNNTKSSNITTETPCDTTPPVINFIFTPDGQNGWFKTTPVTGTVTAIDGFPSNINTLICTGALFSGLTGTGTSSASGTLTVSAQGTSNISCTATDSAGNSSTNTKTIKIDSVAPTATVSYDITTPTNTDVVATATPSEPVTFTSAGAVNIHTFTANGTFLFEFVDAAGNTGSVLATVANIDKDAPIISGSRTPPPNANGWNNTDVTVKFTCSVVGSQLVFLTPDTVLSDERAGQSVTGSCTDIAGNIAFATVDNINIDKSAPLITGSRTPLANANGWNNVDVTVHFDCTDALSDVDTLTPDVVLSSEGAAQSATGTCVDKAGNSATAFVGNINIDKTGPVITGSRTPAANANGWNNTDVTVSFICRDTGSEIDIAPGPTTLVAEGAGLFVTGTCTDKAGNSASATIGNINIDKTAPVITIASPLDGAAFQQGSAVASSYICADALSGAASCSGPVASGANLNTLLLGSQSFVVTAADLAGNVATLSHIYNVTNAQYTFNGFLNPLKPEVYSGVYKLGSTISIKWQLKDASGQYVSALSAIVSLKVDSVVCDGTPDDSAPINPAGAGDTGLRYDSSANQYIFNWQTKGLAEGCYTILLTLNDQSVHSTRVQLKR
jgi:hypothetical protein